MMLTQWNLDRFCSKANDAHIVIRFTKKQDHLVEASYYRTQRCGGTVSQAAPGSEGNPDTRRHSNC